LTTCRYSPTPSKRLGAATRTFSGTCGGREAALLGCRRCGMLRGTRLPPWRGGGSEVGGEAVGFRRDGKAARGWRVWVRRHADALARCGLPDALYADEAAWENFLAEGFLPAGCGAWGGWRVEMLSPEQAARLHALLQAECPGYPF
jgi:hypothetical protein